MLPSPPPGYTTVTPYLTVDDGSAAIEFYTKAFGAKERFRLPMPDGGVGHAELTIGDSIIMLSSEFPQMGAVSPKTLGGTTGSLLLYVEDVDARMAQAIGAGATEIKPAEDQFWGDRMGSVMDPFGHRWSLATPVEQVSPEELQKRMAAFSAGETGDCE